MNRLIARVTSLFHRVHDPGEVVGLGRLQRRELLVGFKFLLPEQLTNREHVPIIDKGGEWAAERAAKARDRLLAFADRLLEGIALDVLDQGEVERA